MRVLVTGGAGFIGSHLVDALLARGDRVTVLDNFRRGRREFLPAGCSVVEGDIRDLEVVESATAGAEVVYHLAAQSNVMGAISDVDYSFSTNVVGTFNVLKAAASEEVRRVVFSSSREIYGEAASLPVNEATPTNAKNAYGASKVAAEAYCHAWANMGPAEVQVLRFANVYGPRDSGRVIPLWIDRALRNEPLDVYGGKQVLDFVWVGTVVQGLLAAAECRAGPPVNVGSGRGTSLLDLADEVIRATRSKSEVRILQPRDAEVVRFVADITRMREHLGILPPERALDRLERLLPRG